MVAEVGLCLVYYSPLGIALGTADGTKLGASLGTSEGTSIFEL